MARLADSDPVGQCARRGADCAINGKAIIERLKNGQVAVIAGFQGIGLMVGLHIWSWRFGHICCRGCCCPKADHGDITDVDGVYNRSADRTKSEKVIAHYLREMLEMASSGARFCKLDQLLYNASQRQSSGAVKFNDTKAHWLVDWSWNRKPLVGLLTVQMKQKLLLSACQTSRELL